MSILKVPVTSVDHSDGPENAPLVLVEYGDYQCPACGAAYPIVKRIQKHFSGRLRFVFRNFPLNELHPEAESAAETAEFASAHGKFWQMHDALYENQRRLGEELYSTLAQKNNLSLSDLHTALQAGSYRERVRSDFSGGVRSGINGTPTFYINGTRHDASFDFETLSEALERVAKTHVFDEKETEVR
jgi:protein-disulfide isomerase